MTLSDERISEILNEHVKLVKHGTSGSVCVQPQSILKAIRAAVAEATKVERLDFPDKPGRWWYLDHRAAEPVMWLVHPNMEEASHGSSAYLSAYLLDMFDGKWVFVPMPEWEREGKNDDVER